MRIAIGGVSHETSTMVDTRTTMRDFENDFGLYRGEEIFERFRGANICAGGFIDGADKHGFEVVPLLWTFAYPSGLIQREVYDALKAEFLQRLADAESTGGKIDGVLLDLHGAMVVEGIEDGDGDFIESVREAVGWDRPIIVTQDLHGNHTKRRVEMADAIVGFDTYPHIDMAERGREAADLIVATLKGEIKPAMAIHQLPILWSAACQVTAHPPIDEAMRRVHEMEQRDGILVASLATGFPWANVPEMGASVIVVADGDGEVAQHAADELAGWVWDNRKRWYRMPPTAREALAEGEKQGKYPIMLADQPDNTGGGAPGDSTEVLKTFLEMKLQDALILYLVDPETAAQAHEAGVGEKISVRLGGKSHPAQGTPVEAEAEVMALSDGQFAYDGPMYAGLTGNMGQSAWLRIEGVNIVVVNAREQPLDPAFARSLGIDCAAMRYISVKSAVHFRSGFEKIAGSIHNINAQAIHTHDFFKLDLSKNTRKMFPVDVE